MALAIALAICLSPGSAPAAHADDPDWDAVAGQMIAKINQIPGQYQQKDQVGVEKSIRSAYYEIYQVSGLEAQVNHRLGDDRSDAFTKELLGIRTLTRDKAPQAKVQAAVDSTTKTLRTDVKDLKSTPELNDQWSRVAKTISGKLSEAGTAYAAGNGDAAYAAAKDAYLAHYEADGLEKATISYLGQARVTQLEAMFNKLRQAAKEKSLSPEEYKSTAAQLSADVTEDAKKIDQMTSQTELGWSGFVAAFLVLLREGAEALLVVAAVITYAMKAGRRDQLVGIIVGVVGALAISAGLAFLFSKLAASATSGQSQELLEGVTGALAVAMLIWVSNWILSKSSGRKWEEYIEKTAGKGTASGGVFALASVAFLAVLREGAETILFFSPIIAGAKTSGDHVKIWLGIGAAVLILAILFTLVWVFGVRLPMKQFFKWTSILLGILAVTIAGGAVKEFQDAAVVPAHEFGVGVIPQISWLGLYPNAETLLAQLVIVIILVILAILQIRRSRSSTTTHPPESTISPEQDSVTVTGTVEHNER
ncbi:MAG: FTR1 family iron permease [Acidipropionibacterium sp.]|jgi:high-affinity iron transporter|nr:FTR1 family iron permease [Acidipropionibacterium sp.]